MKRNLSAKRNFGARNGQPDAKSASTASNLAQLEQDRLLAELETLRQAQIEIEHSQQLYAELFDLAPVGYLNLTPKGKVENANLAACALLGKQRSHVVAVRFSNLHQRADQQKLAESSLEVPNIRGWRYRYRAALVYKEQQGPSLCRVAFTTLDALWHDQNSFTERWCGTSLIADKPKMPFGQAKNERAS